jgi:NAD(P)H-nitrite reductase large subunit
MELHVRAGGDAPEALAEIYLNPLDWYQENDITLHAGDGRPRELAEAPR